MKENNGVVTVKAIERAEEITSEGGMTNATIKETAIMTIVRGRTEIEITEIEDEIYYD